MNLKIKRLYYKEEYTIGKLYIDGIYFCDTLEDKDRGLTDKDNISTIKAKKVFGQTAIPKGNYKVIMSYSPRFQRVLPLLLNVKGFEGIRIHSGNTAKDTNGCILVGKNDVKGMVTNSKDTLNNLLSLLQGKKDIAITIE